MHLGQIKFYVKRRANISETELNSIHRFRYKLFVDYLKWRNGLTIINNMEYDKYDDLQTIFIYAIDNDNEILALSRLRSLSGACFIKNFYQFNNIDLVNNFELSRFGVSKKISIRDQLQLYVILSMVLLEIGIRLDLSNYFASATNEILPVMIKWVKWVPVKLTGIQSMDLDQHFIVKYEISDNILEPILKRNSLKVEMLNLIIDSDII